MVLTALLLSRLQFVFTISCGTIVAIPFFTFRIMVGCGLLMLALAWIGSFLNAKGRIGQNRWMLWLIFVGFPLPWIANIVRQRGRS
jgi:cytochrome bd-type quinol oxidase subunit 1